MAHHGDTEVDRALEVVVSEINSLVERQDGGPPVVLTVGGLVIGGTIIPPPCQPGLRHPPPDN